jgi:predicted metal-dependent hydrolase
MSGVQLRFPFDLHSLATGDRLPARNGPFDVESAPATPELSPLFVRHRRARRYVLRVLGDGRLRVTLPRWGTLGEARAFVDANRRWIAKQRARLRPLAEAPRSNAIRPLVERWFRQKAERELPHMLLALARAHQVTVTRVSVRDQRSRWGACSSKGVITLNWRLIRVPGFVCEYVMLHELMHRRELNHSRRFWRLVAACCPRHAEARAWLKREGKVLWPDCA